MLISNRPNYLFIILPVAAAIVFGCPILTAANAAASATSGTPGTLAPLPAAPAPSEARAVELAAQFFDPLLANAKSDKERASLLHQRGVLYLRAEMKGRALADLAEAMRLIPKNSEERFDIRFHRACTYLLLPTPNPDAAVCDLTICITARPKDAEALLVRALAYRKRGSDTLADADVMRARPLIAPSDAHLQALLADAEPQQPLTP